MFEASQSLRRFLLAPTKHESRPITGGSGREQQAISIWLVRKQVHKNDDAWGKWKTNQDHEFSHR